MGLCFCRPSRPSILPASPIKDINKWLKESESPEIKDGESVSQWLVKLPWRPETTRSDPYSIIVNEYDILCGRFEVAFMMHKLTADYYQSRAFYLIFFPLLAVTTMVSIFGFIGTRTYDDSMIVDGEMDSYLNSTSTFQPGTQMPTNTELSILVGVLGCISTAIASLGKQLNYQSKGDMHESAMNTLRGILEDIRFERLEIKHRQRLDRWEGEEKMRTEKDGTTKKGKGRLYRPSLPRAELEKLRCEIDKHKATFDTMEKSCTVPIPNKIKYAFIHLEELFALVPLPIRFDFYRRYYNDLNRHFHDSNCLCIPYIDVDYTFGEQIKSDVGVKWLQIEKKFRNADGDSYGSMGNSQRSNGGAQANQKNETNDNSIRSNATSNFPNETDSFVPIDSSV